MKYIQKQVSISIVNQPNYHHISELINVQVDGMRIGECPNTDAGRAAIGALLIEYLYGVLEWEGRHNGQ